jgi:hypothetical protein
LTVQQILTMLSRAVFFRGLVSIPTVSIHHVLRHLSTQQSVVDQMLQYVSKDLQVTRELLLLTPDHALVHPQRAASELVLVLDMQGSGQAAVDVLRSGLSMQPDPAAGYDSGRWVSHMPSRCAPGNCRSATHQPMVSCSYHDGLHCCSMSTPSTLPSHSLPHLGAFCCSCTAAQAAPCAVRGLCC